MLILIFSLVTTKILNLQLSKFNKPYQTKQSQTKLLVGQNFSHFKRFWSLARLVILYILKFQNMIRFQFYGIQTALFLRGKRNDIYEAINGAQEIFERVGNPFRA